MSQKNPADLSWLLNAFDPPSRPKPRLVEVRASLPDRVPIPQMCMPDGRLYRWESEDDDDYVYLTLEKGTWEAVDSGTRADAVEWAKALRKAGGVHPFRSVTQLVARSFPLKLVLRSFTDVTTEGGVGGSFNCQCERRWSFVAYADDRASIRYEYRSWGFGWSERRPSVEKDLRLPLTEEGIREGLAEYFDDPEKHYRAIWSHFPWLFV